MHSAETHYNKKLILFQCFNPRPPFTVIRIFWGKHLKGDRSVCDGGKAKVTGMWNSSSHPIPHSGNREWCTWAYLWHLLWPRILAREWQHPQWAGLPKSTTAVRITPAGMLRGPSPRWFLDPANLRINTDHHNWLSAHGPALPETVGSGSLHLAAESWHYHMLSL